MIGLPLSRTSSTTWFSLAITSMRQAMATGYDIKALGLLFLASGCLDLVWILSYPEYALKVFGTTFPGWAGELMKYQHPVIHWIIGYGFWHTRRWAFWSYLIYLAIACLSEIMNQVVLGFNQTRMTMIIISLFFGWYILFRRKVFAS